MSVLSQPNVCRSCLLVQKLIMTDNNDVMSDYYSWNNLLIEWCFIKRSNFVQHIQSSEKVEKHMQILQQGKIFC